ncbi:unnamed protein product [Urochloa humidicola]
MALRSLVVVLKGLSRRMPGFGASVPKGVLWSKSTVKLTDPTKETALSKFYPDLHKIRMQGREASQRYTRVYNRQTMLMGIVGFGSIGYAASNA